MAEITSAGNLIAAVLEQAGYVAQSHFLVSFRDFFREAGALVYILGGIGGVISLVVFGSFRAARYLLLGPALYWFLVGPTTDFDGVIWQVGNGTPRGANQRRGLEASQKDVNDLLDGAKQNGEGGPIKVATGFALFVRPINEIVRGLAGVILEDGVDNEYLTFLGKARALDYLLNLQPDNGHFIDMLESDYVRTCAEMFGYGLARSAFELRGDVIQNMGAGQADAQNRAAYYQAEFDKYKKVRLNPDKITQSYLRAGMANPNDKIPTNLDCDQMWKLVAQYAYEEAASKTAEVLRLAKGDNATDDLACRRVMEKIGEDDGGGACNLQSAVALYMLKNAVFDRRATARFVKRITDTVNEPKGVQRGETLPLGDLNQSIIARANDIVKEYNQSNGLLHMNPFQEQLYIIGMGEQAANSVEDLGEKARMRSEFQSVARLSAIGGPLDAGFMEYPKYHLKILRQQLFTFAMHLPYWQGVLLYMLAVAYPFLALLVLLPGRAVAFLNLPLAWLWVKSWDVGFAVVMLFERVLWNILPTLNIRRDLLTQPTQNAQMTDIMSEALKFDHVWNLHMYYMCLATATLAIPLVTGMATLRSKRSMLSSFTDKVGADAKAAGQLAGGAHGMRVMADRVRMVGEVQGMAATLISNKGVGYGAQNREASAQMYGKMAALTKVAPRILEAGLDAAVTGSALNRGMTELNAVERAHGKNSAEFKAANAKYNSDVASSLGAKGAEVAALAGAAYAEYTSVHAKVLSAEVTADRGQVTTFDPMFGRFGKLALMNEAFAAAMDGSGGFEINKMDTNPVDSFIDLQVLKTGLIADFMTNVASARVGNAPAALNAGYAGVAVSELQNPLLVAERIERAAQKFGMGVTPGVTTANPGPDNQVIQPFAINKSEIYKALSLTDGSVAQIKEQLGDPTNSFATQYQWNPDDAISRLSVHAQTAIKQAMENNTTVIESFKDRVDFNAKLGEGLPDPTIYHAPLGGSRVPTSEERGIQAPANQGADNSSPQMRALQEAPAEVYAGGGSGMPQRQPQYVVASAPASEPARMEAPIEGFRGQATERPSGYAYTPAATETSGGGAPSQSAPQYVENAPAQTRVLTEPAVETPASPAYQPQPQPEFLVEKPPAQTRVLTEPAAEAPASAAYQPAPEYVVEKPREQTRTITESAAEPYSGSSSAYQPAPEVLVEKPREQHRTITEPAAEPFGVSSPAYQPSSQPEFLVQNPTGSDAERRLTDEILIETGESAKINARKFADRDPLDKINPFQVSDKKSDLYQTLNWMFGSAQDKEDEMRDREAHKIASADWDSTRKNLIRPSKGSKGKA